MRLATVLVPLLFVFAPAVNAETWHVPGDCPTIQAGIDSAASGDTVVVACGTYYEHDIQLKPGVYLTSETGEPECATIDAQGLDRVLYSSFPSDTTYTVGFTITGGSSERGGGLYASGGGAHQFFISCVFSDNVATTYEGGAVYLSSSLAVFVDCLFINNTAEMTGGAFRCTRRFSRP